MQVHHLAVLIITKEKIVRNQDTIVFGKSRVGLFDRLVLENYIDLLSAANIPFDVISQEDVTENAFANRTETKYSTIIICSPLSKFSDHLLSVIAKVSYGSGVSIVTAFNNPDNRTRKYFGIEKIFGQRILWPLRIRIIEWPGKLYKDKRIVDYGVKEGFSGIRKRGLLLLHFKTLLIKILRAFKLMIITYISAEASKSTTVFCSTLKGKPIAWSYKYGNAMNYYFALNEGVLLSKYNEMCKLFRKVLCTNSGFGMVSLNHENTMVLRIDDPGACSAVYLERNGILENEDWRKLGKLLKMKEIPISLMYTPTWIDDGDEKSGKLYFDGKEIKKRAFGKSYLSSLTRYEQRGKTNTIYDYQSECNGIKILQKEGIIDIHSHGLTHLISNYRKWAKSSSRKYDTRWYNEFYNIRDNRPVKKDIQLQALAVSKKIIENIFDCEATSFTPSGHVHDSDCDILAHDVGYLIFSSNYTGILRKNLIIRNWHIPSLFLFLKKPNRFAMKSGYPFVGVIHDYEIKGKFGKLLGILRLWEKNGVRRFISLRELSIALAMSISSVFDKSKSQVNISITPPIYNREAIFKGELDGCKMLLDIVAPNEMYVNDKRILVKGASIIAREKGNDCLRLYINLHDNKKKANISIALKKKK